MTRGYQTVIVSSLKQLRRGNLIGVIWIRARKSSVRACVWIMLDCCCAWISWCRITVVLGSMGGRMGCWIGAWTGGGMGDGGITGGRRGG